MSDPILVLRDLTVSYDGIVAVSGVDLQIHQGERHTIVGESGSGKSTVCMAISGFLPASARIEAKERSFEGQPIADVASNSLIPNRVRGTVTIFQDAMSSLDPIATIGKQFYSVLNGLRETKKKEVAECAAEFLCSVGLTDVDRILNSSARQLSGGMRQRVMIALALASEPRLVIADEPTSALDASLARETMEVLTSLTARTGAAFLLVSHDIALCSQYSDRLLVMRNGRVVEQLSPEELTQLPAGATYARQLFESTPTLENWDAQRLQTVAQRGTESADA